MDTVTDHSTAEVLSGALAALRTHGWTQYILEHPGGEMCLRGAILFAVTGSTAGILLAPDDTALIQAAERALWKVGTCDPSVIAWNDASGRSFEDVERALTAAIAWAGGDPS